jgi:hypothetical protein
MMAFGNSYLFYSYSKPLTRHFIWVTGRTGKTMAGLPQLLVDCICQLSCRYTGH